MGARFKGTWLRECHCAVCRFFVVGLLPLFTCMVAPGACEFWKIHSHSSIRRQTLPVFRFFFFWKTCYSLKSTHMSGSAATGGAGTGPAYAGSAPAMTTTAAATTAAAGQAPNASYGALGSGADGGNRC